ncbi:MAG: hypothetical protein AAF335_02270 [Bacteroidota bacterium]
MKKENFLVISVLYSLFMLTPLQSADDYCENEETFKSVLSWRVDRYDESDINKVACGNKYLVNSQGHAIKVWNLDKIVGDDLYSLEDIHPCDEEPNISCDHTIELVNEDYKIKDFSYNHPYIAVAVNNGFIYTFCFPIEVKTKDEQAKEKYLPCQKNLDKLFETEMNLLATIQEEHPADEICISSDGRWLARKYELTGKPENNFKIWDTSQGKCVYTLNAKDIKKYQRKILTVGYLRESEKNLPNEICTLIEQFIPIIEQRNIKPNKRVNVWDFWFDEDEKDRVILSLYSSGVISFKVQPFIETKNNGLFDAKGLPYFKWLLRTEEKDTAPSYSPLKKWFVYKKFPLSGENGQIVICNFKGERLYAFGERAYREHERVTNFFVDSTGSHLAFDDDYADFFEIWDIEIGELYEGAAHKEISGPIAFHPNKDYFISTEESTINVWKKW